MSYWNYLYDKGVDFVELKYYLYILEVKTCRMKNSIYIFIKKYYQSICDYMCKQTRNSKSIYYTDITNIPTSIYQYVLSYVLLFW